MCLIASWLLATPWTIACQALLYMKFPRQEYYISYSRASSWTRDQTYVSCIFRVGWWILYHLAIWEVPVFSLVICIIHSISSVYVSVPQLLLPHSPLCPYIWHLSLYFCFANKIICTVSLDSTFTWLSNIPAHTHTHTHTHTHAHTNTHTTSSLCIPLLMDI